MDRADTPLAAAWSLSVPVLLALIVGVPLAVAVALWLTARRRGAGWSVGWAARASWAEIIMIAGTAPFLYLTLSPGHNARGLNIVPLHDLAYQFRVGFVYATVQITGNLLVFAALGFGLPIRWRVGPLAVLVAAACCSTAVESSQWIFDLGRFASVDDVIVNAAGAVIGAGIAWPWWRKRRERLVAPSGDPPSDPNGSMTGSAHPDVPASVRSVG